MAFVFNPNKDQQDPNQPQQGQANQQFTSGQGSVITGQSSGAQGAGAAQVAQKPGSSGQFTNVSSFIKANDPSQLTNQVTGQIGQQADQAKGQLSQASSEVDKSAQATGEAVNAAKQQNSQIGQSLQNAYAYNGGNVKDADYANNVANLKNNLGMQYQGPSDLGNQNVLQAQASNLSDIGAATQNASGRNALLQRFFNNPTYSGGQRTLDTALLGSQRPQLQQAAAQANSFGGQLDTARRQALNEISQARQGVQGAVSDTTNTIQGQEDLANKAIGQRATQAQGIRDLLNSSNNNVQLPQDVIPSITGDQRTDAALQQAVNSGFMTQADVDSYKNLQGRASNVGFNTRDLLGAELLPGSQTGDQLNAIAASQQQASRLNQLQDLVGQKTAFNPYQYDPNAANQAVSDRENAIVNAIRNTDYNFATPGESAQDVTATAAKLGLLSPIAASAYLGLNQSGQMNQNAQNALNKAGAPSQLTNLLKYGDSSQLAQNIGNLSNSQLDQIAGMKQFGSAASAATNKISQAKSAAQNAIGNAIGGGLGGIIRRWSDINLKHNIKEFDTKPFLDSIQSYQYEYTNKEHGEGPQVSPMAQDLEKTPEGKALVIDTPQGKLVDYGAALGLILAALSDINKRITVLEDTINRSK